jgi:DinB superfamily
MTSALKLWTTNRNIYFRLFDNYTLEQLNKTPNGFSNNLVWNLGHIIVTQQRLVYKVSNLPMHISDELLETYKTGIKPTGKTTQEEVDKLKSLLLSLVEQTKNDFTNGKFTTFGEMTTSTGFHLAKTKEAIEFNNYHEGLHLGFMMNIRKFI